MTYSTLTEVDVPMASDSALSACFCRKYDQVHQHQCVGRFSIVNQDPHPPSISIECAECWRKP